MFGEDAYPTLHGKAAALFQSLARNHVFLDGNKRTALLATGLFYRKNGLRLGATEDELVALTLAVATGELDVHEIAEKLEFLTSPAPSERHPDMEPDFDL